MKWEKKAADMGCLVKGAEICLHEKYVNIFRYSNSCYISSTTYHRYYRGASYIRGPNQSRGAPNSKSSWFQLYSASLRAEFSASKI